MLFSDGRGGIIKFCRIEFVFDRKFFDKFNFDRVEVCEIFLGKFGVGLLCFFIGFMMYML